MNRLASTASTVYRLLRLLGVTVSLALCWFGLLPQIMRPQPALAAEPEQLISMACEYQEQTVFAAYQLWHGLATHQQPPPYDSRARDTIVAHIEAAQARCIQGFVVDWYGQPDETLPNAIDRAFMDSVLVILFEEAAQRNFKIVIMYDEGTFKYWEDQTNIEQEVIADLLYAKDQYFQESAYYKIDNKPMLFIFPYSDVKKELNWGTIRTHLGEVLLIDQDPNPRDWAHDQHFDGFYAWVKATDEEWGDGEWGEKYLRKFYTTTQTISYTNKIAVGGVWAGFDDTLASWSPEPARVIARTCGGTWQNTWNLVDEYQSPFVLIATWNDFEEGSDIENGILKLRIRHNGPVLPKQRINFIADFSGCSGEAIVWDFGDGKQITETEAAYIYANEGNYPVQVTATEGNLTITTAITVAVSTIGWSAQLTPINPSLWITYNAEWGDPPATLQETGSDTYGKTETIPITLDIDKYPWLIIHVDKLSEHGGYTVQVLDKREECVLKPRPDNCAVDVLKDIQTTGLKVINLARKMKWTDQQTFTINLWIIGDNQEVTFHLISIEHMDDSYLPIISNQ